MESEAFEAIWISDVHLGSRACREGLLLDFLRRTRCSALYLVGDIVDIQSLRRRFYWPASHTEVLRLLMQKRREGTRVIYVPGNHDRDLRAFAGRRFGGIEIRERTIHTTSSGKRLLVLHGDELDAAIRCGAVAAICGAAAYKSLLAVNRLVHWANALLGRPYWSLAQHVKARLGNAMRYVDSFRDASLRAAADGGYDGVVCGHIHMADLVERDGLLYCNDGDWVESCTALVEDRHGQLRVLSWRPPAVVLEPLAVPLRDAA
jgi:UDP-2,3-diacylglucosamine pyrophosphatase LpxH